MRSEGRTRGPSEDLRGLCAAKDEERNFRRDAEADGSANGAKSTIDVEHRCGRLPNQRWVNGPRTHQHFASGRKERALVEAGDVVGNETRGGEAMVEDFDLDLSTVRVACER